VETENEIHFIPSRTVFPENTLGFMKSILIG